MTRKVAKNPQGRNYGRIFDPIYKYELGLFAGGEAQKSINWYASKNKIEPWILAEGNRYGHFASYRPYKNGVLWFAVPDIACSVIAHECFHAAMYLFECIDLKTIDANTEEIFAYYLEWLTHSVKSKLNGIRK